MTRDELIQAYRDAYDEGYVTDLEDPEACNGDCVTCPASQACEQLSNNGNYKTFVKNYKELLS